MNITQNIQFGARGEHVKRIQFFLRGQDQYLGVVDGDFGPMTKASVEKYQRKEKLPVSGQIGNWNLLRMLQDGMYFIGPTKIEQPEVKGRSKGKKGSKPKPTAEHSDHWPPRPPFRPLTGNAQRARVFGEFKYKAKPTKSNPEGIEILGNWRKENITTVDLPELAEATDGKYKRMSVHVRTAEPLKAMWREWGDQNLLGLILSYSGAFYPRYIRGSRKTLSNHSFGSAFDVNYAWNKLGRVPALAGDKGSLRELIPIAHKYGFYWGGHFTRRDGMHFEQALLLKPGEWLDIDYAKGTYTRES